MTRTHLVVGTTSRVDAWSIRRLPFEPAGWLVGFRSELRNALRRLAPAPTLCASYGSQDRSFSDLENVLFYNVGGVAFTPLGLRMLVFERRFEKPVPPVEFEGAAGHHYEFATGDAAWHSWREGPVLAEWENVHIPSNPTPAKVWAAMRTSSSVICLQPTEGPELTLTLNVGVSPGTSLSVERMKKLIDGVVATFHAHDGSGGEQLMRRVAAAVGPAQTESVDSRLIDPSWALLGTRRLVHPWGNTAQWNPADERLVAVRYELCPGKPGAISGRLTAAIPEPGASQAPTTFDTSSLEEGRHAI